MTRAALYVRVSTEEQAKEGLSVDAQLEDLRRYAANKRYEVMGVFMDEGFSARKAITRRKGLAQLLEAVKANKVDTILFIKLDRWCRSNKDFFKIQEVLDDYRVTWETTQEEYKTTTTEGRLMLGISRQLAETESDKISDRIKFVFKDKKARGEALSGNLPWGYCIGEDKKIKVDVQEVEKVRDCFDWFLLNQSVIGLTQYMRDKYGIDKRHNSWRRLLKNDSYIGTFYEVENYAEGIIDNDTFRKVQDILTARRTDTPQRKRVFLFTGLIKCPSCGHVLVANRGHANKGQDVYKNFMYRCPIHNIEKACDFTTAIFENTVEKFLLANLYDALMQLDSDIKADRASTEGDKLKQRVKYCREQLERLNTLYIEGFIDKVKHDTEFAKYNNQLQEALLASPVQPEQGLPKHLNQLLEVDISATYGKLSREGKKAFWHSTLRSIDILKAEKGRSGVKEFGLNFLY